MSNTPKMRGVKLTDQQRLAWLRLIRSDNVGPATFRDLINHFGAAETALEMLPDLSQRGGALKKVVVCPLDKAERELEAVEKFGGQFVGIGEPEYPDALRAIDSPPPLLTVKGDTSLTARPSVSIVGSRNASLPGVKITRALANKVGTHGYVITSGLARGIDTAAHTASLETGTIAAMAGGLSQPYPPENTKLYEEIHQGNGLVVSEMPFGWSPIARDFPRRNRIIAGISLGVVVVEAAKRSGSLITARLAGEFGRLLFAIPGSPLDPRSSGTNDLIKNGAILTTSSDDVLEALAPLSLMPHNESPMFEESESCNGDVYAQLADKERELILNALGPVPVEIDDIIRHTNLPASAVYLLLLELDLAGRLNREAGGLVSIVTDGF